MQSNFKIGLIGCGLRGSWYIHSFQEAKMPFTLAAVADTDLHYARLASRLFADNKARIFATGEEMLNTMKDLDGVIIASPNHAHRDPAVVAMQQGVNLLLEKPVAASVEDMQAMWQAQVQTKQDPIIGFVLRYAPFYAKIREICKSGILGQILVINAEELMSDDLSLVFARGDWRPDRSKSGGLMSEKCSHDMDLLNWLADSQARQVSSFAQRTFLTPRADVAENCRDCPQKNTCRFTHGVLPEIFEAHWPPKMHGVLAKLKDDACVFSARNTYPDHQASMIQFENGILSTFTVAQCQPATRRTIHVLGSEGRLYGVVNDSKLQLFQRGKLGSEVVETLTVNADQSGHNGGDSVITRDFFELLNGNRGVSRPGLRQGIEATLLSFAADKSAEENRPVMLDELRRRVFTTPQSSAVTALV